MRKSWVQLYAPFLVLAMVQAMFIAVAPSRGPQSQGVAALGSDGAAIGTGGVAGSEGTVVDPNTGNVVDAATGEVVSGGTGATGTGTGSGTRTTTKGGTAVQTGSGVVSGSTAHCKNGHQAELVVNNAAPCTPKFTGDNGGATFQGVTKDKIKVIIFGSQPNEQVDAILGAKGLAAEDADVQAARAAFYGWINKTYELYGRKIDYEVVVGDCPTTPPDYAKCNAAAQEVVKRKPALIVWNTSLYASVFDIWAKAGIPSIGGSAFDVKYFTERRPYRFDLGMDGTQSALHIAEYYCKKMAGQKADHTGQVIHPQIGTRGSVDRKLGIVVPEIEANVSTAKTVASKVKECGGGEALIYTYESDINRAAEQTQATVTALIQNKVTTVTCMCDPIAPVFLTTGMSQNQFFPEFLLPGLGLLDYDLLGQLYDAQQMQHAFGPSHLPQPTSLDESDPAKVWRAMGNSGHPCKNNGCGLPWAFANAVGIAIQAAGPKFTPATMEAGMLSLPAQGGWEPKHSPLITLYKYGRGDYTGLSDVRDVYWDASATTPTDGSTGAYINVPGSKRYTLGEWPKNGLAGIPVSPK